MTTPHRHSTGVGRRLAVRLVRVRLHTKTVMFGIMVVVVVFALLGTARGAEATERVIVLQPGLNAVGWVGEATAVADLFAELPEATAVYAWDPINQRYLAAHRLVPEPLWTLSDAAPGMGILVSINSDAQVEWQLSLTPASGTVRLWPGLNLVAWSGRDNTPLAHALRGVGNSAAGVFVERDGAAGWINASSSDTSASDHVDHLTRGEALWVRSSRRVNWLQPTDVLPQITADISATDRARVIHALRDVAAYFDQTYGIQADPARFELWFSSDPDHPSGEGYMGYDFLVPGIGFINIQSIDECYLATLTAHEYAHVLQAQLDTIVLDPGDGSLPYTAGIAVAPTWMVEGAARLVEVFWRQSASACDGYRVRYGPESPWIGSADDGSAHLEAFRARLNDESLPLGTLAAELSLTAYNHGALAMRQLTTGISGSSLFEFWRLLSDEGEPPETLRDLHSIWRRAFESAFGLDVDEFYSGFHQWQCEQAVKNGHPEPQWCATIGPPYAEP